MEHIPEEIQNRMRSADPASLLQFAQKTLNTRQQNEMQALLRDPQALERLMQSEKAQALLRRLQS